MCDNVPASLDNHQLSNIRSIIRFCSTIVSNKAHIQYIHVKQHRAIQLHKITANIVIMYVFHHLSSMTGLVTIVLTLLVMLSAIIAHACVRARVIL